MFETLMARAQSAADRRAEAQVRRLAAALEEALPADVAVAIEADGVRLSGRALGRRLALEWTMTGLVR